MRLIIRIVLNALALMGIAYYLVAGIHVDNFYTAIIAAVILGIINALIKPVLLILTLPVNIITLGFFTLVINAALFWFASSVVKGFTVDNFVAAFFGALFMSVASWIISALFSARRTE